MKRSPIFLMLVLLFMATGCLNDGKSAGSADANATVITEPEVDVPPGALPDGAEVTIETDDDPATITLYEDTAFLFDAGPSLDEYIRIVVPQQPNADVTIRYPVPQEFLEQLGDDYRPMLYAQIEQGGADDEQLVTFEPLEYQLESQTVKAMLPAYVFSEHENLFEAVVILGSIPVDSFEPGDDLTKSVGLKLQPPTEACLGAIIGNPLESGPELKDRFGMRFHPKTHKFRMHYGTDLVAPMNSKVHAVADGTIERIDYNLDSEGVGWGHYAVLRHSDQSKTLYAHLVGGSAERYLHPQKSVKRGDVIAESDSSGGVTGPHLHLEYAPNGKIYERPFKVDPYPCIASVAEEQEILFDSQIVVSDNGLNHDDAFEVSIDGFSAGATTVGDTGTFAMNELRRGTHTLTIKAISAPDNNGTAHIILRDGVAFDDGSTEKSVQLNRHETKSFQIVVR